MASTHSVVWTQNITDTETLSDADLSSGSNSVVHSAYNLGSTLTASTTPAVTAQSTFILTLSGGAATIDLRTLTQSNGATLDGNGLKVQLFRVKNLGANPMTFTFGASNPYNIFGATGVCQVPVGGSVMLYGANNLPVVGSTTKYIDVSGTGAQTAQVTVVLG